MIRNRFTRWLPLAILVGCGAATELDTEPPSQDNDFIGGGGATSLTPGGGSMGNVSNGARAGTGHLPVGGSSEPIAGSPSSGGTIATGGFPAMGGSPNQGGSPAQGGSAQGFIRPNQCLIPFDPGPCRGAVPVFAYIDGSCAPATYGGCEGNENRFATLEQCMAICDGRPFPLGCPEGRVQIDTCIGCSPDGGCTTFLPICASKCKDSSECGLGSPGCDNGICVGTSCF